MARTRVGLKRGLALADAERVCDREKWAAVAVEKRSLGQRKETTQARFFLFSVFLFLLYFLFCLSTLIHNLNSNSN
jgi:hypothetical protein